jgi:hypothetical protein
MRESSKSQKKVKLPTAVCKAIRKKAAIQFDYHGTARTVSRNRTESIRREMKSLEVFRPIPVARLENRSRDIYIKPPLAGGSRW